MSKPAFPGTNAPNLGPNRPTSLPIGVKPSLPSQSLPGVNSPNLGSNRPTTLPGAGGTNLPGNNRPGFGFPNNGGSQQPGVNFPNRPGSIGPGGGDRPLIGQSNRPGAGSGDRPSVLWPNRPGPSGERPGINLGGGDRPAINWKPGINNNGSINTVVSNRPVNNNFLNQTNVNHFTSNNWNAASFGGNGWGYRPYGGWGYGYNPYVGAAAAGYGAAWANNYAYWNRGYHPWYNGCYQGYGYNSWGVGGPGLGIGLWGLSSLALNFGYSAYSNPFVVVASSNPSPAYQIYVQPVINVAQAVPETDSQPAKLPESAAGSFDKATADFKAGNYKAALSGVEKAIASFPKDVVMHEFKALCLFALRDYQQSSAVMHSLLASGPGWDWTTMSSLYPDIDIYKGQLQSLVDKTTANPNDAALVFLLGYHQMTAGDTEAARGTIRKVRSLLPKDPVVDNLYRVSGAAAEDEKDGEKKREETDEKGPDIRLDIMGEWKAARPDGGTIGLDVRKDGRFSWEVTEKSGKKDAFEGTFTLEGPLLVLERASGGALMGRVMAVSEKEFAFKVVGGPADDPGLVFRKK